MTRKFYKKKTTDTANFEAVSTHVEKEGSKSIFWFCAGSIATMLFICQQLKPQDKPTVALTLNEPVIIAGEPDQMCKIAIFYEAHHDPLPAQFIETLLPSFKHYDYTTFLFEEPQGSTIVQTTERLSIGLEKIEKITYVPKSFQESLIDSLRATLSLLNNIQKLGLNYVAVDMDEDKQSRLDNPNDPHNIMSRDQFMAKSIDQSCKEHGGGQVLLVGAMHGGTAFTLKKMGYNITSAYIINHSPLHDPDLEVVGRGDNDIMLRTGNNEYMRTYGYEQMYVINQYDDDLDNLQANMTGLIKDLWST